MYFGLFELSFIIITILLFISFFYICKLKSQLKCIGAKFSELKKRHDFLIRDRERLNEKILILEKKEINEFIVKPFIIGTEKIQYNPIFKSLKALVGNYDKWSSEQTRKILTNFGLSVDIVRTGDDILDKIKNGNKYDIIFTNNIYQQGIDGTTTLQQLKQIDGFNTPVVIHTISANKRDYFVDTIGFDEYIVKPIKATDIENILKKLLNKIDP